jgi:hypothetical protein
MKMSKVINHSMKELATQWERYPFPSGKKGKIAEKVSTEGLLLKDHGHD